MEDYFFRIKNRFNNTRIHKEYKAYFFYRTSVFTKFLKQLKSIHFQKKFAKLIFFIKICNKIILRICFQSIRRQIQLKKMIKDFNERKHNNLQKSIFTNWNLIKIQQKNRRINHSIISTTGLQILHIKTKYFEFLKKKFALKENMKIKGNQIQKSKNSTTISKYFDRLNLLIKIKDYKIYKIKRNIFTNLKKKTKKNKIKKYGKYILLNFRFNKLQKLAFFGLKQNKILNKNILQIQNRQVNNLKSKYFDFLYIYWHNKLKSKKLMINKKYKTLQIFFIKIQRKTTIKTEYNHFVFLRKMKMKLAIINMLKINKYFCLKKSEVIFNLIRTKQKQKYLTKLVKKSNFQKNVKYLENLIAKIIQKMVYVKIKMYSEYVVFYSQQLCDQIKIKKCSKILKILQKRYSNSKRLRKLLYNHFQSKRLKIFSKFVSSLQNNYKLNIYLESTLKNQSLLKFSESEDQKLNPKFLKNQRYLEMKSFKIRKKFQFTGDLNNQKIVSKLINMYSKSYEKLNKKSNLLNMKIDTLIMTSENIVNKLQNEFRSIIMESEKNPQKNHEKIINFYDSKKSISNMFNNQRLKIDLSNYSRVQKKKHDQFLKKIGDKKLQITTRKNLQKDMLLSRIEFLMEILENKKNMLSLEEKMKYKMEIKTLYKALAN